MKIILGLLLIAAAPVLLSGCSRYYQGPVSEHFDGKHFFNPGQPMEKGFFTFLKWRLTAKKQPWPPYSELQAYDKPPERVEGEALRLAYVGHATMLLQTQGLNILTDPVWSLRTSPVSWAGPKRVHPPGISFADLPPIDIVLISHNHYDHLDLDTLAKLWERHHPRIIVPLGNDSIISKQIKGIEVEAYDWGETISLGDTLAVYLSPVQHWSARGLVDRNKALWAAFTLTSPAGNIYFAGDTGYGDGSHFRQVYKKFGSFRLALLPIGSYDPRWFMAYGHMDPEEAVMAWKDLGNPSMIPMHYGIFQLADTGYHAPLKALQKALIKQGEAGEKVTPLKAGENLWVPQ